jgi:hypothetical protein
MSILVVVYVTGMEEMSKHEKVKSGNMVRE